MCVRDVDVQCVLQFTLINAAGCALHRRTSRVIHRLESFRRPRYRRTFGRQAGGNEAWPRPGSGREPVPQHGSDTVARDRVDAGRTETASATSRGVLTRGESTCSKSIPRHAERRRD